MARIDRRHAAVGVALALAIGSVVAVRAGSSSPHLPPTTPDGLAASAAAALARDPTIQGEIRVHVDLGLPDLGDSPELGAVPFGFLAGDSTLRIWRSPFGARIALVESVSERDFYFGHTGAWTWDFGTLTATRLAPPGIRTGLFPLDLLVDEDEFRGLLHGLEPTTRVSVDRDVRVAGRDAYRLVLEPRTPDTLVGRVEIDVDAERRVPLAVRIVPRRSATAALSIEFTSVSFADVDPHLFDFTPPAGATVREAEGMANPLGLLGIAVGGSASAGSDAAAGTAGIRSFGHDWASVVAIRMDERVRLPDALTRFVPFSAPLVSARWATGSGAGWLLVGAVPQRVLARVQERELRP